MRVLITDGNERAALAVTRALGREQVEVVVGADTQRSLAGSSRYCRKNFVYPSPHENPAGFVATILEMVRDHDIDAVFPISDIAMHLIGPERAQFERFTRLPSPPAEVFQEISDKYRLMQRAVSEGVGIPETIFVPDGNLKGILDTIAVFPVVVKPGCSLVKVGSQWKKTSVCYAESREDLLRLYDEKDYLRAPSLIQQRVVGAG